MRLSVSCRQALFSVYVGLRYPAEPFIKIFFLSRLPKSQTLHYGGDREEITTPHPCGAKGGERMKDSYEQRIQNQFGAFCVRVLKNEARYIQRELASLQSQEKSFGELTASELEQTAVWDKHFMSEHVFEVLGLPVVVAGDLLADALAQLPEGKRDVILLSYFLGMTDREISEKLNIVHQTVSKRRLVTLKELREYLMKEGFEWPDK